MDSRANAEVNRHADDRRSLRPLAHDHQPGLFGKRRERGHEPGNVLDAAEARDDVASHVGLIFSGDTFYNPGEELMEPMVAHGVLAVEMEASALYTLAAAYGRKALAICTVSDHIVTGEETTPAEREQTFGAMVDIALSAAAG